MKNKVHNIDGFGVVIVVMFAALLLYAVMWFIDVEKFIVVEGKHWTSYAEWTEDYTTYDCSYDAIDERTECEWNTHTRTLCSNSMTGDDLPVVYPTLYCRGDDYNEYVSWYVTYHEEDTNKPKTARTNFTVWNQSEKGNSYSVDINLLGHIKSIH